MIKGTYDPVKETPPVPSVPVIISDSIYRVCGAPPAPLCSVSHVATGVVHVFPRNPHLNAELQGARSAVTYGLLSKVLSPKEAKERAKQAMEKKKSASKDDAAVKGEEEKAVLVRVVCHVSETLTGEWGGHNKGEIHSGKVWVSAM